MSNINRQHYKWHNILSVLLETIKMNNKSRRVCPHFSNEKWRRLFSFQKDHQNSCLKMVLKCCREKVPELRGFEKKEEKDGSLQCEESSELFSVPRVDLGRVLKPRPKVSCDRLQDSLSQASQFSAWEMMVRAQMDQERLNNMFAYRRKEEIYYNPWNLCSFAL